MERHKTVQFPSPFFPEELELDPEKALWVPGKKKIFVPSLKQAEFLGWRYPPEAYRVHLFTQDMYEKSIMKLVDEARFEVVNRREVEEREARYDYCECVPGRAGFLGISRDVPVTYNDIRRSENPQFRSNFRGSKRITNYW